MGFFYPFLILLFLVLERERRGGGGGGGERERKDISRVVFSISNFYDDFLFYFCN